MTPDMMNSGRTALTTTARRSSDRPATPAHLAAHLSTPALLFSFNAFPKTRPLTAPETRGSPWIVLLDCPLSGPYTDHYTDGSTLPTYYHTYSLLTTHHSPLTTHYSLLTAYRLLLATYRPANLTTHYSLLTTHYSLLTTHTCRPQYKETKESTAVSVRKVSKYSHVKSSKQVSQVSQASKLPLTYPTLSGLPFITQESMGESSEDAALGGSPSVRVRPTKSSSRCSFRA